MWRRLGQGLKLSVRGDRQLGKITSEHLHKIIGKEKHGGCLVLALSVTRQLRGRRKARGAVQVLAPADLRWEFSIIGRLCLGLVLLHS